MSLTPEQPEGSESNAGISDIIKEVEELTGAPPGTEVPTFVMEVYNLQNIIRVHLFLFCKDEHLNHLYLALEGRLSVFYTVATGFSLCMRPPLMGIYTSL